jgi:anthranilate phosphoribosyltransferase
LKCKTEMVFLETTPEKNSLLPFMKKVGTGVKGSRPLSREEAYEAMQGILRGEFHPTTFGAFAMALRFRMETEEELTGFLSALHDTLPFHPEDEITEPSLDSAGAYDGKERTYILTFSIHFLVASAGIKVLLHGSEKIPTKEGTTPAMVLKALGINPFVPPDKGYFFWKKLGFLYLHQPIYHPLLYRLTPYRKQIGKRIFLNTIEPLINPFHIPVHTGGFFHEPYAKLIVKTALLFPQGFSSVGVVAGVEGSDELRPPRSFFYTGKKGEEEIRKWELEPEKLSLSATMKDLHCDGKTPEEIAFLSAERTRRFLEEPVEDGYSQVVYLNAGFRFWLLGKCKKIEEGMEIAREIHRSGKGAELLYTLQKNLPYNPEAVQELL